MNVLRHRAVAVAVVAVFGLGLLGTAAFAALGGVAPSTAADESVAAGTGDRLKAILDALVTRGVITQAQEQAILEALKEAAQAGRDREHVLKRIVTDLLKESADYLGIGLGEVKTKLPGTSLGAIADATPGKSADGLTAHLVDAVNAAVAKALAEGRITQEQADRAEERAPEHVARFVERVWPAKDARPRLPKIQVFIGDVLQAARDYLGLPREEIATALRSGKSLGEIADATPGKSRDGLVATITSAANARIAAAEQQGTLTAEQATKLRTAVEEAVTKVVDRKPGDKTR